MVESRRRKGDSLRWVGFTELGETVDCGSCHDLRQVSPVMAL